MAPCIRLHTTNKIKLEAPGSVNKCYMGHTDIVSGDFVAIYTWKFHMFYASPLAAPEFHIWVTVQIKAVAFMTAFVVYPEAIIRGQLL